LARRRLGGRWLRSAPTSHAGQEEWFPNASRARRGEAFRRSTPTAPEYAAHSCFLSPPMRSPAISNGNRRPPRTLQPQVFLTVGDVLAGVAVKVSGFGIQGHFPPSCDRRQSAETTSLASDASG